MEVLSWKINNLSSPLNIFILLVRSSMVLNITCILTLRTKIMITKKLLHTYNIHPTNSCFILTVIGSIHLCGKS